MLRTIIESSRRSSSLILLLSLMVLVTGGVSTVFAQAEKKASTRKAPTKGKFTAVRLDAKVPERPENRIISEARRVESDAGAAAKTSEAEAQEAKPANDGTDPTKLISFAGISSEYISIRGGFYNNTVKLKFSKPITKSAKTNFVLTVPLVNTNVLRNNGIGIGDVGIKFNHVAKVTRQYGIVVAGEMVFATASRTELGTGKNVFKGTFTYAKFLKGNHIFAPTIVQSNSLWGKSTRARVNNTVFDFYIVPKLKDPKTFITIDPALTLDWVTKKQFGSVAVTIGRAVGKMLGGQGQVFVKPSFLIGGERSANWGIEFGFKVLGF